MLIFGFVTSTFLNVQKNLKSKFSTNFKWAKVQEPIKKIIDDDDLEVIQNEYSSSYSKDDDLER